VQMKSGPKKRRRWNKKPQLEEMKEEEESFKEVYEESSEESDNKHEKIEEELLFDFKEDKVEEIRIEEKSDE